MALPEDNRTRRILDRATQGLTLAAGLLGLIVAGYSVFVSIPNDRPEQPRPPAATDSSTGAAAPTPRPSPAPESPRIDIRSSEPPVIVVIEATQPSDSVNIPAIVTSVCGGLVAVLSAGAVYEHARRRRLGEESAPPTLTEPPR